MALPRLLLASVFVVALVGIVSADYRKGRSLKPYPRPGQALNIPDIISAIQIQGLVYCKKGGKLTPIEGAMARVTCLAYNKKGFEAAPFSVVTPLTNEKGYFKINLGKYQLESFRLTSCKVFLEAPAPGSCTLPTDTNSGLTGAPLANYRPLSPTSALYSVGPFVYKPSPY